ncbi:hypothetical protein PRIPAC_94406 [Pristionchus pacificus]|uniref:Uncharacterized protein n=1 Tax=Pristionchus pacificus TaxID=54126 RepID=A0A2A6BBQ4_PRIPA|nr:hypothetical protein PRIPAC_94406 [Pristionchus pacificus]|eukprot:PDM63322.1 hypothetical protein PRIPAC_50537 [Pristionchus pacificus]
MVSIGFLSSIPRVCFVAVASHYETCEDEIAREREEDWKHHGCRSCKFLPMEESNCPKTGYDCDLNLPTTSNVLRVNCECAQLRCADGKTTLAVNGTLVGRLRCFDAKWTTKTEGFAPSGVCARKCGLGVCKTPSNNGEDSLHVPMDIRTPDNDHPCAWGSCQNGAVGSSGDSTVPYDGQVQFSCAGDGKWKGPDGTKHDSVQCFVGIPCWKLQLRDPSHCPSDTTCKDPIVHTTIAFECPPFRLPAFQYSPTSGGPDKWTDAVTCDMAIGQWMYHLRNPNAGWSKVMTQAEFDQIIPRDQQLFTCN